MYPVAAPFLRPPTKGSTITVRPYEQIDLYLSGAPGQLYGVRIRATCVCTGCRCCPAASSKKKCSGIDGLATSRAVRTGVPETLQA